MHSSSSTPQHSLVSHFYFIADILSGIYKLQARFAGGAQLHRHGDKAEEFFSTQRHTHCQFSLWLELMNLSSWQIEVVRCR